MIGHAPDCVQCKWYKSNLLCKAFPDGIPKEIIMNEIKHIEPLPDQKNDIVFERK